MRSDSGVACRGETPSCNDGSLLSVLSRPPACDQGVCGRGRRELPLLMRRLGARATKVDGALELVRQM